MSKNPQKTDWIIAVLIAAALPFVLYFLWTTTRFVIAYQEIRHVHVFPTQVQSDGWDNSENAKAQDLPSDASFSSFSLANSAYAVLIGTTTVQENIPVGPEILLATTTPADVATSTVATSTPEMLDTHQNIATSSATSTPANETSTSTPFILEEAPVFPPLFVNPEPESASSSVDSALPLPEINEPVVPATTSATSTATTTSMVYRAMSFIQKSNEVSQFVLSQILPVAYATTTAEIFSTTTVTTTPMVIPATVVPPIIDRKSVSTCAILGEECHTMQFSGFGIAGELREKEFHGANVNLSMAALAPESSLPDARLVVRYFHNDTWRTAGEIYLNKELTNQSNNGYFSVKLAGLDSWSALDDLKIEVELVREDERISAEVYVDSVWVDASYNERIQDILSGRAGDDIETVADNVSTALREDHSNDHTLFLADGSSIAFNYTDDLSDKLYVRADKSSYKGGESPETVYVSITNTGTMQDSFTLDAAFPAGRGAVSEFAQYFKNVATTTQVPRYGDVTYFCEAGWTAGTDGYACDETQQSHVCASLSESGQNCIAQNEVIGYDSKTEYVSDWIPAGIENTGEENAITDSGLPSGFRVSAFSTKTFQILPGQTLYFKLTLTSQIQGPSQLVLSAKGGAYAGDLDATYLQTESFFAALQSKVVKNKDKNGLKRLSTESEFSNDDLPKLKFAFKSKRNFIQRAFNEITGRGNKFSVQNIELKRDDGEGEVPVTVDYGPDGQWTMQVKNQPRTFKPGKYRAHIVMKEGIEVFDDTVEFYWGVLVINLDKSTYRPGENALLQMGVLDQIGNTVCDANLRLTVTAPDGRAINVPVRQSELCGMNNVVDSADYLADYATLNTGVYKIELAEFDRDGNPLHRITDSFKVEQSAPFIISRSGASRIWPVADYRMTISVTADRDFEGEFIESIPADFLLVDYGGADTRMYGAAKNLVWPVSFKAGETKEFSYVYDAPDISPYVYVLGPAKISAPDGNPFSEGRQWKLASDATGNMLLYWDRTYVPTGWTCVSCITSDPFYQRFVMGSSTPSLNGGAATHTHTATGAISAATTSQAVGNNNQATPVLAHTHTYTPTIAAASNLPAYRQLALIQYNSTGEPTQIPGGAIAIFDVASSSLPSGWYRYAEQDGKYVYLASTSTVGATGGSNTHTHTIGPNNTGNAATTFNAQNPGAAIAVGAANHTHSVSTTTVAVSSEPPYVEVLLAKITATTSVTAAMNTMIAMWSGSPPEGWTVLSSSSNAFDSRFIKASTTYGQFGGSATGTHANINGIITSGPSATANRNNVAGTNASALNHSHLASTTNFSTTDIEPPYRGLIIAKREGGDQLMSSYYSPPSPFDSEKAGTSTPYFEFISSDPDGTDTLSYQFQLDDDTDLDTSPILNRTSDVETGCSPNCFENRTTPLNTSPFNEGERIRFTLQNSGTTLSSGTTYYWRVRSKESGASQWSAWATTTSYTYVSGTAPSEWFQTEDGQFDTDTLSGVETYGDDSVRTVINPPSGVLVAYGEGSVQTPRYRLWNGSSWSAESSAQNVGGTILWVATAAGTTRDEYILATQDDQDDVNVQVYDGVGGTWGDLQEVTTGIASTTERGFDVAYETVSGRGMVVYCDGDADPSYYTWNGTSWTFGGTIDVSSSVRCGWIKLASNPVSNEIIMVERNTGTTANSYEAQVWNGSTWGSPKILGQMNEANHEGIAVQYEESGNQAVVVVSNNTTSGFLWTAWNGTSWDGPTPQTIGDDFEWGKLNADVGSDNLALCYVDQDINLGYLIWNGSAWGTFVAGTNEREATGNSKDGRPVDCAYETTAGRDGYLLYQYSDATNGRYQYYNGTSWTGAEASVLSVQDSWQVGSVRAGDGKIHSYFWDDSNTEYELANWNGSAWSNALSGTTTIETSSSVTATPFRQPIDISAQLYEANSGTIKSSTIDFSYVSSPTWGDVTWKTTEPSGTSVTMQVMYYSGGSCSTLIPDVDLPGNSTGFSVGSVPLDISGLSTVTYSRICLQATLSTGNSEAPTLDEWGVSWQRNAFLSQQHFRWYANVDSLAPSDLWPTGASDIGEDITIPTTVAPKPGDVLRLRMSVMASSTALTASSKGFKLQYAEGSTCSASMNWLDVGEIGSTTAHWRGYDNTTPLDAATLSSVLITSADTPESYEEENNSALNPNAIAEGDEGEWDWTLEDNTTENLSYCFRMVTQGGDVLNEYVTYPSLITNSAPEVPTLSTPFNYEALASTTPWFTFTADDTQSNEVSYQVQVDDSSTFSSVNIDERSDNVLYVDDFINVSTPSDKDPFNPAQTIQFIPISGVPLSNNTTYYWRVRAIDGSGSGELGEWSDVHSFTVDTSVTVSTWYQTTFVQFSENDHDLTEATSTVGTNNEVVLTPPNTFGTTTGPAILFSQHTSGNVWGALSWHHSTTTSSIRYRVEYYDGTDWNLIPEADLAGNTTGFQFTPVSLLGLSPTTYDEIRVQAALTNSGATPHLLDWTVSWGTGVNEPTPLLLFDNEKTSTTTPTFTFYTTDPQSNDLEYELSIGTLPTFTSSTTRNSVSSSTLFANVTLPSDTHPFTSGNTVSFSVEQASALTNGNTYWWKVRARDPSGGDAYGPWSEERSFTVDTSVTVSTWYQTTTEQFDTDTLSDTETNAGTARITSLIREAFVTYAESTVQVPRFRIWNGTSWGGELSGVTVNETIRFIEAAAAPLRDEYIIGTEGASGNIYVQVVDGTTDIAGNKVGMATTSDPTQRGFDIAYETLSGDALVVSCYGGTEATYRVWNGSSWSATSSLNLSINTNCEWVKLASDPTSDEVIAVFRDATTGTTDYQTYVWDGNTWGNTQIIGSKSTATSEGIAIEYEESGGDAVVVYGNGTANSFNYKTWNGTIWSSTSTLALSNDFESGRIARDVGSDNMVLCYVDASLNIGISRWDGTQFLASQNFLAAAANASTGHPMSCDFETTSGRDGYIMLPYSNTTQVAYTYWNGSGFAPLLQISTMGDSAEVRSVRTGDGNILVVSYNDGDTQYDFSYWNGTTWSTAQNLNTNSIATVAPPTIPVDIVARRYPTFLTGSVESTDIAFADGSGVQWGSISFSKTTPGASTLVLQVEYYNAASSTWDLIPDAVLSGNSTGISSSPITLTGVDTSTYASLRLKANLTCSGANCPTLNDWTLAWGPGVTVSGTAKQFDQSTNVTSGTVAVAVNGTLQFGKTSAISAGTWSISNVRIFSGDVVEVFISGVADTNEAVAVTKYDGSGNITSMNLFEKHLVIGSDDNPTITNSDLSLYDYSAASNNEDIFFDVDAGNDLTMCRSGISGCFLNRLLVKSNAVFRPDSASSGNVTARHVQIEGTIVADGNTFSVNGSWLNNYVFTKNSSTVIFTATSTAETINSSSATTSAAFNVVTFGLTSGTTTWTLQSVLGASSTLSINSGTLVQGANPINLDGSLSIGASGIFAKGTASTTFMGSGSNTWTDSSSVKQDLGTVVIDGSAKTVTLGSSVKATNITIGADDTFNAGGSNTISVLANWSNNNIFTPQTGTVAFISTSTSLTRTVAPGGSSFYNLTFNGGNGLWAFTQSTTTVTNDFQNATGTVTLPTATTTVGGAWDCVVGICQHNNGTVLFNTSGSSKNIRTGTSSPFYDLTFNGSGSWLFGDLNATSSRAVVIQAGTVQMPAGTLAIGGSLSKTGGTLTANSGTLKFYATNAQTVTLGGSNAYNMTFNGIGGSWVFGDTNATSTNTFRIENGTTTMPSGSLGVGGSFLNVNPPSSGFVHNNGIVRLTSTASGNTVLATGSNFYKLIFNGIGGSWTISGNATSTSDTTFTQANSITLSSGRSLEVDGMFTNNLVNASTTWTGATLYLNSGTAYPINAKGASGDTYAQLTLGNNTNVASWNSSATNVSATTTSSLYSQNNASSSGSLYIYGTFATSSNIYWDYARDFDGIALVGGGQRQVNVKIASSSVVTLMGSSSIQGISTASTTIANQGSGFYTMQISAGTTTARYYSFASTTPNGLMLFGSNTVLSTMDNGEFVLTTSSSSAITLGADIINRNPGSQILYTRFATTTGVVTANNVMSTSSVGISGTYWWFKNGYGNLYGESFDMDPLGNPGQIQFDDSGITVNISGRVYSDHGTTAMGPTVCDGSTPVVVIRTSGGLSYSGPCDGSGNFIIAATFTTSNVLTAYLNTNGGARAVAITKNVTAAVSGFDLYQNSVIIRQFDSTPTTISDMSFVDSTIDSDIPFTATSSVMFKPDTELYVWTGKAFAPGGDVILQSGGSGDLRDGRLYLATSSTFTFSGSPNFALGGGMHFDSGATFTTANSTTTFAATTTGKAIFSTRPIVLNDVVFSGSGGQWILFGTSTATTTMRTMSVAAGTVAGTGDVDVQAGGVTGAGTIAMTGGTFLVEDTGSFGGSSPWSFSNLTFGTSTVKVVTKTGAATTTVSGVLRISSNMTLNAGSAAEYAWVLSGAGTPFVINGTFNALGVPFFYTGTTATNVTAATYGPLYLAPTSGSPTYTISSGNFTPYHFIVGNGAQAVTVTSATNDPNVDITGDLVIGAGSTYVASDAINSNSKGNWTNNGTYTPSGRLVIFDATTTGKTITPGASPFYDMQFNSSVGGWTILGNATSTHNTTLSAASSFVLASGKSLEVNATFSNSVASSSQTWTGSILYLNSGTSYSMNTKTSGNATYGQLTLGANTNIRNWNSYAATTTVPSNSSMYAQNFSSSTGKLYIWGAYSHSSGSDYWDYSTDFDGTALGATSRKVDVYVASSSVLTFSGGLLDIIGAANASTTIQVQTSGNYAWSVTGGTINAQYYEVRNTNSSGLNISGYPTVTGLDNGDFLVASTSYSAITIDGTVISANPLKVIKYVKFATTSPATSAFNVTAANATSSYWKFNLGYGNAYGEQYDNDPGGDPGFVRFDNSNDHISVSGNVYSDEGSTVSSGCDNSTQIVRLKVAGLGSYTASCDPGTGLYTFPDVGFNPGDILTLYLASSSKRSATVSRGPTASITGLDIYEKRVILRHEDATPLNIADTDIYDSGQDSLIPFSTSIGGTNTMTVEANTKVIVWTGKTFAPAGNLTIESGGVGGSVDGSLELFANSTFSAAGTQVHSIGGSFIVDTGATYSAANSTVTFTATTTGKTITPNTSPFYDVTFNGTGGNWAFSAPGTSTNNFVISAGTVTLPTSVLEVGGSFLNTGGTFQHNNGTVKLTSTATEKAIMVGTSPFYDLAVSGVGGSWRFVDGFATTSNNLTITNGTFRAPTSTLAIGGSFSNGGTFTANSGIVRMYATAGGKTIQAGGSNFYSLRFDGVGGGWGFNDTDATTSRDFIIATGTVSLPTTSLGVGGNFMASSTFYSNNALVRFSATTTGFTISVATSTFSNILFDSAVGGWTIISNATSTATTTISNAASFTLQNGKSLEVGGVFTNSVGGAATTWTGSTLFLNSGTSYSLNTKINTGDTYGQFTLGANTVVRSWGSNAATTTAASTGSLYSQNHAGTSGALYVFGTYSRSSGTDHWSYATDFDGTDISGAPRQVNVRIATSSSVAYSGATLNIVGVSTASTTIFASGTTGYAFSLSGGTINAQYYQFKNMDENGVVISGLPTVTSLSYGDFELSAASGTAISLAGTVVDANASLSVTGVKFSSTTANLTKGYNVMLTSTPGSFWSFVSSYGNISGESFDLDGSNSTLCGHIRWDDSDCQFLNEAHYRWRNDDGGEGAVSTTWYDTTFTRRQKIAISNANATGYTNLPVKLAVEFDSDMQSDFDDLRFTDSSGTSSISFWRERTVNSASTTLWVKVPTLSSLGSATIYMYYGSSTASSADNGSNVFSYFDDFEDNDISDYAGDKSQVGTPYFDMSQSASFNYTGSRGLPGSETSGQTPNGLYKTGSQTGTNKTIRWWQNVNSQTGIGANNDEPCTLFGVQTPGGTAVTNTYAVCLDEAIVGANRARVSIARDTHTRDVSGTVMASTSVTYPTNTTTWYEVVTDWISSSPANTINVSVYNASGGLFASLSTTSNTYSSGGIGFSHFNQGGGWDNMMVKQYTAVAPTYLFASEQQNNGATWRNAEDTAATAVLPNQNIRLRFSLQNTGTAVTNHLYRLQYAPKGAAINCESVDTLNYNDVPTNTASCGVHAACMKTSSQFTNLASTSPSLSYAASLGFTPGYMVQDPSNQSNGMSVGHNVATEVEYNFQITNSATQPAYCFRVVNGGTDLANYDRVAEASIAYPPYLSDFSLNSALNINLDEGTSTIIYATSTVTDNNGYTDIVQATSSMYRSGVAGGAACSSDENNCYQSSAPMCSLSNCSGNSCTLSCVAYLQYFAEPTDAGSTYSAQNWLATLAVQDTSGYRDTQTTSGIELNTLRALAITTGDLDFGSIYVGDDSGYTNATTTARNTGNVPIDIDISGTNLQGSLGIIATSSQKYATTTFAYGSCSICQFLSGTAAPANVNVAKPTSTSTAQERDIYFGITIPTGTGNGLHTGVNTFTAIAPSP